ncbi:MAG: Nif11-like leader peptide family natural product precursor [Eggerthellaceae bacterium]|nr:Nif11-like leader peptide family natural product precursor [Eggerthellaceae bacterium]
MNFEDLTEEQKAKAKVAKTPEEILALAKEEGYELSDEDLEAVSGGIDVTWGCSEDNNSGPY